MESAHCSCSALLCGPLLNAKEKPNIVLISVDDLNDWIGVLGGHPQAKTPGMNGIASKGMLFTNAHCQSPVCNPSRASLMTSLYPTTTGSQGHALAWDDVDNDSQPELITGKRYFAHSGKDAGAHDEITIQYYDWNPETGTWSKHLISSAPAGQGPGIGLQIRVHDLDGNGWKDVIVPGKSGTHIVWNEGR
jgi:hypothetical protein